MQKYIEYSGGYSLLAFAIGDFFTEKNRCHVVVFGQTHEKRSSPVDLKSRVIVWSLARTFKQPRLSAPWSPLGLWLFGAGLDGVGASDRIVLCLQKVSRDHEP